MGNSLGNSSQEMAQKRSESQKLHVIWVIPDDDVRREIELGQLHVIWVILGNSSK